MTGHSTTKFHIALWLGSIAIVIAIGLYSFPREYGHPGFWESLYSTLRLFVFEHDLPHFPKSWPLIAIYFIAPLITVSALGTAISYLFRMSPVLKTILMADHVVICGIGRTGKLLADTLNKKRVPVVGVDLGPPEEFDQWCHESKVPLIFGDFNSCSLLEKAGALKARSIIFASGNDLFNLEGALGLYEWMRTDKGPPKLIWAHIANEKLANTARRAIRTEGKVSIRFFDTYRIAAARMIAKYFNCDIRKGVSEVTILGFGKFGRDLVDMLINDLAGDENFSIKVIDIHDREKEVVSLAKESGFKDSVTFMQAAIQDIELIDKKDKAFFLCTDDDLGNLTGAMELASDINATHIYVRMAQWPLSAVVEHLGEDRGVHFININELMVQGIEDLPGIFQPATDADLKRMKKR